MSKMTKIAWAHSTRSFWMGCTRVGPGCDHCYSESFNRFIRGKNPETGEAKNWGPGAPRVPHVEGAKRDLLNWNNQAAKTGEPWRVFINSHSDTFDNEVPTAWRDALWATIRECPHLTFLLLTKRIGNVPDMLPADWGSRGYLNAWLGITVVNQEEADRDIPKLLTIPARIRWLSVEPQLGPIELRRLDTGLMSTDALSYLQGRYEGVRTTPSSPIAWVVNGGESGHHARHFDLEWARSLKDQCAMAGVPYFMKQLGARPFVKKIDAWAGERECKDAQVFGGWTVGLQDRAGADITEFPEDLRIREFPL